MLKKFLTNVKNIDFRVCKTNRVWLRDLSNFCKNKSNQKVLLNWGFNAWAKYKDFYYDNKICDKIKNSLSLKSVEPVAKNKRIILEGGSIDVNGKGFFNNKRVFAK